MDYSLLLVVETLNPNRITKLTPSRNCLLAQDNSTLIHIGIIDYLQDFNFAKRCEMQYKSLTRPSNQLSVQPPDLYSKRFIDFVVNKVIYESRDGQGSNLDEKEEYVQRLLRDEGGCTDAHKT
jgi:hypothetical protein